MKILGIEAISSQAPLCVSSGEGPTTIPKGSTGQASGKWYPSHSHKGKEDDIVWPTWRHVAGAFAYRLGVANQVDKRVTLPSYMDSGDGAKVISEFDDYSCPIYLYTADLDLV